MSTALYLFMVAIVIYIYRIFLINNYYNAFTKKKKRLEYNSQNVAYTHR